MPDTAHRTGGHIGPFGSRRERRSVTDTDHGAEGRPGRGVTETVTVDEDTIRAEPPARPAVAPTGIAAAMRAVGATGTLDDTSSHDTITVNRVEAPAQPNDTVVIEAGNDPTMTAPETVSVVDLLPPQPNPRSSQDHPVWRRTPREWVAIGVAAAVVFVFGLLVGVVSSAASRDAAADLTVAQEALASASTQEAALESQVVSLTEQLDQAAVDKEELTTRAETAESERDALTTGADSVSAREDAVAQRETDVQERENSVAEREASVAEREAALATPTPSGPYYRTCKEAREARATPLYRGSPGYRAELDPDGDGIACDR